MIAQPASLLVVCIASVSTQAVAEEARQDKTTKIAGQAVEEDGKLNPSQQQPVVSALSTQSVGRADDNAVTAAEDAFGSSIGNESIGLYSPNQVRGFSPVVAGNVWRLCIRCSGWRDRGRAKSLPQRAMARAVANGRHVGPPGNVRRIQDVDGVFHEF